MESITAIQSSQNVFGWVYRILWIIIVLWLNLGVSDYLVAFSEQGMFTILEYLAGLLALLKN